MKVLVTGGAGFIGSHIADAYVAAGHDVVVVDSLWERGGGRRNNVPDRASFVHMDVREANLEKIFSDVKPDVINHHAAQHTVAYSVRDPVYDAAVNVVGLLNILQLSVKTGVRKVIFASSAATYGAPVRLPLDERTPQRPESPYGITKLAGEQYLRFYRSAYGLDYTAFRYGNVYGPRQDAMGEAGVVAAFVNRFLARETVRIDWDGDQTRDYVYVKDLAALNLIALERGAGSTYCIGSGVRTSVNELYRELCELTGESAAIERAARREGDIRDSQMDPTLANAELSWRATTPLQQGLRETYDYFRGRLSLRG